MPPEILISEIVSIQQQLSNVQQFSQSQYLLQTFYKIPTKTIFSTTYMKQFF